MRTSLGLILCLWLLYLRKMEWFLIARNAETAKYQFLVHSKYRPKEKVDYGTTVGRSMVTTTY